MIIRLIQQKVSISAEVSIFLKSGEEVCGRLVEIGESHITIRSADGAEDFILEDQIARWKVHAQANEFTENTSIKKQELPGITQSASIEPPATLTPPLSPTLIQRSDETKTTYPVEVITQAVEINVRFKTAIPQANLEPRSAEFKMPEEISSLPYGQKRKTLQGEWDKLKSKYEYAVKQKELNRLNEIIRGFEQFIKKYPEVTTARFNLGCIYIELNKLSEAIKAFESAIAKFPESRLFYNLGAVALRKKDTAKACYALQEFFKLVPISQHLTTWYKFLGLALDFGVLNVLIELLQQAFDEYRSEDIKLILESAVFVLESKGRVDDARQLMAFIQQGELEASQTIALLELILNRLNIQPTDLYRQQQEQLLKSALQMQEAQEQAQRQEQARKLLTSAQQQAKKDMYNQAIAEVRKALQIDPENILAKQLEAEYRDAGREQGLIKGSGSYAQAQRARILDKDFKAAEKFYREAIKKKDRFDSAVLDLASLLQQLNRDEEAIQILCQYRNQVSNKLAINNLLANAYHRLGKHQEEVACLEEVSALTSYEKRSSVLNRIAVAYYRLAEYQKSEDTLTLVLRYNPQDQTANTWLTALREAQITGIYTEVDRLFIAQEGTADAKTTLSNVLTFHLERCDYAGVEASKISSKQFSEKDVEKLIRLAEKGLGTERPRERASNYLSSAKILMDLGAKEEDLRLRRHLRNFCAAMGDACIAEQKHRDVARSYYSEAFLIAPDWIDQLDVKLSQYIMLYYSTKPTEDLLKKERPPAVESCLEQALKIQNQNGTPIIEGLLYLSRLNPEVGRVLINKIHPNKRLRTLVQDLCYQIIGEQGEATADQAAFLGLWERGRDFIRRRNQEALDEFAFLNSVATGLDSLQEQIDKVQALVHTVRGALDRERLSKIKDILTSMYDYSQQLSYVERERFATIIQNRATDLIEEIEKSPTKYSFELFRPYLLSLSKTIGKHFGNIQLAAEPNELQTTLAIDSYIPDSDSIIRCQINISNEIGKSPASSIIIQIENSPEEEYRINQKNINVREALAGGESVTCEIPVSVTEQAKQAQVFTLYYSLSYTTRAGKQVQVNNQSLPIRLDKDTDFQEIHNPYAYWAEAHEVTDPNMFFGRDEFINKLVAAIKNAPGAKSLVIYGQKRAGKSSVLYHLKQRLKLPIIPVKMSMLELGNNISLTTFLRRIFQCIEDTFEDLIDEGYPQIYHNRPSVADLERTPELSFQEYMSSLRRELRRKPEYKDAKIILLIDEFTYLYGEIERGKVPDTFMKYWKALLQQGYFGSVLVGQDVMRQFISRFPNEFQVAQSERVSYLAPDDARKLIINPICIPETDESRYKGAAVDRLMELTAGSPFYIQIFCNRLVDYMNNKKLVRVTDAHIEQVKEELLKGTNSLTPDKFDNLISANDDVTNSIPQVDALAVLRNIAFGSRTQTWCDRSAITAITSVPLDDVLEDLVSRDVLEKQSNSLFRIRVGLFKDWLLANQ
ncbi:MAG: hypothetical protein Fur006_06670 [Coleofasciculaceae cyanobacterium]